jgi:antimicrobial peptide system SdpA family protein
MIVNINLIKNYKYRLVMLSLILFSVALFLSLLFASTTFNPIQNKLKFIKTIFTITPQGWAFFTRDAREEQIYIYKIVDKKLCKLNQKHSSFDSFLGLSRQVAKLSLEIESVSGKIIKDKVATSTNWNYDEDIIGVIPKKYIEVNNPVSNPILCGDYLLVYHEIVPWAWYSSNKKLKMPAKVIKLKIICQN